MDNHSTRRAPRAFAFLFAAAFIFAVALIVSNVAQLSLAPTHASITTHFATPAQSAPNIDAGAFFAADKAQRGRPVRAAVVLDIPNGFHVNSNRPLGKYAVPTVVKIEAPAGVRVSPVVYPRSIVRRFKFSEEQLGVYEGRPVMRFNVTVPANYAGGEATVRARVRFQSCNDEVCFPPATRDLVMQIPVVGANEKVERRNTKIFGTGK